MLNEEMRKYLNILNEDTQVDEIKVPPVVKAAALSAAVLGGAGKGLYDMSFYASPLGQDLRHQIEMAQDPAEKKRLKLIYDKFQLDDVEPMDPQYARELMRKLGWKSWEERL